MAYLCIARWTTSPEYGDTVFELLQKLAERSRLEPGNRTYEVFRQSHDIFRIVEVYDDELAFQAHLASSHFVQLALESAVPLLLSRSRAVNAEYS